MGKIEKEAYILSLAKPLLLELYGEYTIVTEQKDKPDAAIEIKNDGTIIGIEITSVDKEEHHKYLNDEKITSEIALQQIKNLLEDGSYSNKPIKRLPVSLPFDYIFEGVIKKSQKYQSYADFRNYEEILILAFSSHLNAGGSVFNEYHKPWTNFLLSEEGFPFDKVIFVSDNTRKTAIVYNKASPLRVSPLSDSATEAGVTAFKTSILPSNEIININSIFSNEPHVPPGIKSKKKRK
jgi:hypothetical protein